MNSIRSHFGALWPLESAASPVVLLSLASKAEGIGFPSLGWRCLGFSVFTAMIHVEKKHPEAGIKIRQRERWLSAHQRHQQEHSHHS